MPALRQVAPVILKEVLEVAEWKVYNEDKHNWSLVNHNGISVEIPKRGRFVSFQIMEHVLSEADMPPGDYFKYLDIVQEARRLKNMSIDGFDEQPRIH
jgi:hypothetical protein